MAEFSLLDAMAGLTKTDMGEILPEGLYPMKVIECTYAQSAKKGTPGWKYKAVITDGEFEGETLEGTAWFSKTKGGIQFFWSQMRALGITAEWMQAMKPSNEQVAEATIHARFMGEVGIERPEPGQQGRIRNRLVAQSPLDAETGTEDNPEPSYDDDSGDVLVDDIFAPADATPEEVSPDAELPPDPGADDGTAPDPDGSAGEPATPLPIAEGSDDEDDPWS